MQGDWFLWDSLLHSALIPCQLSGARCWSDPGDSGVRVPAECPVPNWEGSTGFGPLG